MNKEPKLEEVIFTEKVSLIDVYGFLRPGVPIVPELDENGDVISCKYEQEIENHPTPQEIEECTKMIFDHYEKTKHHFPRMLAYPSIGDQLDALYHAGVFPDDMAEQIKQVKDKYPKS